MEKPTNSIKDPKIRAYMENVTEGRPNVEKLTAEELEEGVCQFIDGLDKVLAEADEMIMCATASQRHASQRPIKVLRDVC